MYFSAIFLEFSITGRLGTDRNENFNYLSFLASSNLFWIEMKPQWYFFFNFLNFLAVFFGIFYYASVRNETERQFLFSLFLSLFQPILPWNEVIIVFFNFLNFSAIFLEFSITRRVETKRNDNFYFLSLSAFANLFWVEMKP